MKIIGRIGLSLLLLACGLLVFGVFSHYFPVFHGTTDAVGRMLAAAAFLAAALLFRRRENLKKYWLIPLAYFIGISAISVDYYLNLSQWILSWLGWSPDSPEGWAIDKLESSLLGILIVIVLNRMAGQSLDSIYIRRGRLWLGLGVGLAALVVMIATVIPVTQTYFKGENLSWARILGWMPWVFIFVLANASNEELIFRGLFIGRMEPFLGKIATNLVTTIPFVFLHAFTSYSANIIIFLALQTLPVALAWCWLMQKTNSIWGSILFHAAMDIPIVVGIFSSL